MSISHWGMFFGFHVYVSDGLRGWAEWRPCSPDEMVGFW